MLAAFGTIGGALFGFDVRYAYYYLDKIYTYIYTILMKESAP